MRRLADQSEACERAEVNGLMDAAAYEAYIAQKGKEASA